jgi:acetolactate synthase I/III small subunit
MSLHTVSVLVEDQPGVLTQVSSLFARRAFNIHSLAVGTTERPGMSRMTIVVEVTAKPLEQVTKQLNKLVSVIKVTELEPDASVERELALIKVHTKPDERFQVLELAEIFRARVIDVARSTVTIEVSGPSAKVDAFCELLEPYGLVEMARTGRIALARGEAGIKDRLRAVRG